jgi:hypothetical protein
LDVDVLEIRWLKAQRLPPLKDYNTEGKKGISSPSGKGFLRTCVE